MSFSSTEGTEMCLYKLTCCCKDTAGTSESDKVRSRCRAGQIFISSLQRLGGWQSHTWPGRLLYCLRWRHRFISDLILIRFYCKPPVK